MALRTVSFKARIIKETDARIVEIKPAGVALTMMVRKIFWKKVGGQLWIT